MKQPIPSELHADQLTLPPCRWGFAGGGVGGLAPMSRFSHMPKIARINEPFNQVHAALPSANHGHVRRVRLCRVDNALHTLFAKEGLDEEPAQGRDNATRQPGRFAT